MEIRIKRMTESARLPYRGSKASAGLDLYADRLVSSIHIGGGMRINRYTTGIAVELPPGLFYLDLRARSSCGGRRMMLMNGAGVGDWDYRGEIQAEFLVLPGADPYVVGERILQMIVAPYCHVEMAEADDLTPTARGQNGFGSTGRN